MDARFSGPSYTLGVEEELMILDGESFALANEIDAITDAYEGEGEVKSMHVLAEARGRGLSRMLLRHLVAHARQSDLRRLSLETGVQPGFVAARGLYAGAGFSECPPFGAYRVDPNSVFMTMSL